MPQLRRYKDNDYEMIASWYEAYGKPVPKRELLSDIGYIADNRVVGFLYITNSSLALIENVIANPKTVPSLRRESLKKLCTFLIDKALLMGYTHIVGITNHPSIDQICQDLGFVGGKFNVWALDDTEDEENVEELFQGEE